MINQVIDKVTKTSFYLGSVAFSLIFVLYVVEVVLRYFFNAPTSFSTDVIQWLFTLMIMLCLPEVTSQKGHIIISFFLEKMQTGHRDRLERILSGAGFIICMITTWMCFSETVRQYQVGIETNWNTPIPKWWILIVIPFGFGLTGLHFLRNALKR